MARKKKYIDPLEQSREAVEAALASFTTAEQSLRDAASAFETRKAENDAVMEAIAEDNERLQSEVERALRVADRIGGITQ